MARLETFTCMRRTNANTLDSLAINTSGANSDVQELRFESTARRGFVVAKCVLRRAYQRHRAVPRGIHVVDPGARENHPNFGSIGALSESRFERRIHSTESHFGDQGHT